MQINSHQLAWFTYCFSFLNVWHKNRKKIRCKINNYKLQTVNRLLPSLLTSSRFSSWLGQKYKILVWSPVWPHFYVTLHVLLEVCRRLELLVAGLTGVDLDAWQLLAVLFQVQRELALENKLISALCADQILQRLSQSKERRQNEKKKSSS